MNIYITHNLGYNPLGNRDAKQCRLYLKLQPEQTSNFVQYGSKMWAEIGLCKRWLD